MLKLATHDIKLDEKSYLSDATSKRVEIYIEYEMCRRRVCLRFSQENFAAACIKLKYFISFAQYILFFCFMSKSWRLKEKER